MNAKINAVKHMGSGRSLKELATHLGLSQTTVSRVINHSGGHASYFCGDTEARARLQQPR